MNFKKTLAIFLVLTCLMAMLTGCGFVVIDDPVITDENGNEIISTDKNGNEIKQTDKNDRPISIQTATPKYHETEYKRKQTRLL